MNRLCIRHGPRTENIEIFLIAVDPKHSYSTEARRANEDNIMVISD